MQTHDFVLHGFAQALVERAERLVHQHDAGLEHERARERTRCCCPPESLRGTPVRQMRQLDHLERALHARLLFGAAHVPHGKWKRDVLRNRQMRKERVVLKHHADVAPMRRLVVEPPSVEAYLAVRGRFESREHHERGRLARTGRTQQRQEFSLVHVEIQVVDDVLRAIVRFAHARE